MIIRREKRSERFSVLNTEPIEDKNLSAVALGIYVYIMSKPDNWNAHKNEILKRFGSATIKTSKNVIDSAFSELIKAGYIVLKTIVSRTDENKVRFAGKEYLFFDTPQLSKDDNCRETEILEARQNSKIDKSRKSKGGAHITNTDLLTNINIKTNTNLITKEQSDFSFSESSQDLTSLNDKKQTLEILPVVVYQKPKKQKEKSPQIYPANFTPAIIRAIENFIEYRKEIKKPFKSEKSQQTKINQWSDQIEAYGEMIVLDSIETAIANGWQGTFIDMKKVELQKQSNNLNNQFKTKEDATFAHYYSQLRNVDYGFND